MPQPDATGATEASAPLVAYLSHSYRPEDRAINMAIWQRLNAAGMVFAVDPPNLDKRPMDITFLERMMQRSDCFVAIVPDRRALAAPGGVGAEVDVAWSPYQSLECRLALRANKPRMLILEKGLGRGPLPESELKGRLTFNRSGHALPVDLDAQIDALVAWARTRQDPPEPMVGLLRWDPPHPHWHTLLGQVEQAFNTVDSENCEILEVDLRKPDHRLLARARAMSMVIVDMHPAVTPPHIIGLLHGAAVPMYRTCLLQGEETAEEAAARLGLVTSAGTGPALASLAGMPSLLTGYQVDPRMQPVKFWKEPTEETARDIVQTIRDYQQREVWLQTKPLAREYFLSLRGNRVFISTPGDLLALSGSVKKALDDAGMPAFHYKESRMEGGTPWKEQLEAQIRDADLLLGLISPTYWDRIECVDELDSAVQRWERHQMQLVLYADGNAALRLPKFLGRVQVNRIGEPEATCRRVVEDLRARFDGRRRSMEQEIQRLAELVKAQAPLDDKAAMRDWLQRVCGLQPEAVEALQARVEGVKPEEAATKLVRVLMGAIHESPYGGAPLGGLCLELRSLDLRAEVRTWLNSLFSVLRLYPNLHNVRDWNARRQRQDIVGRLKEGAPVDLLRLTSRAVGLVADPMAFVRQLGAEIAAQVEFEGALEAAPQARIRFRCSIEDLSVPVEWLVPKGGVEHLGRLRPIYRWIDDVAAQAPRDTLESSFGRSEMGPPRMLMYGAPTAALPNVALELQLLQKDLRTRYAAREWPAAPLLQHAATGLQPLVENSDFDILHLAGHAGFEGETAVFQVADGPVYVTGDELANWLRNSSVRFVYLSCCEGAGAPLTPARIATWRRSLCRSLLEAGVAEVLAFYWTVDDAEAVPFTRTFYENFFPGFDAPAALHKARLGCSPGTAIWASSLLAQRAGSSEEV